jgi:hypothetical protein
MSDFPLIIDDVAGFLGQPLVHAADLKSEADYDAIEEQLRTLAARRGFRPVRRSGLMHHRRARRCAARFGSSIATRSYRLEKYDLR